MNTSSSRAWCAQPAAYVIAIQRRRRRRRRSVARCVFGKYAQGRRRRRRQCAPARSADLWGGCGVTTTTTTMTTLVRTTTAITSGLLICESFWLANVPRMRSAITVNKYNAIVRRDGRSLICSVLNKLLLIHFSTSPAHASRRSRCAKHHSQKTRCQRCARVFGPTQYFQ